METIYIGKQKSLEVGDIIFVYNNCDDLIVNNFGNNFINTVGSRIRYASIFNAKYGFVVTKLK